MSHIPAKSLVLQGDGLALGSFAWPNAHFPTLWERATLVAVQLPSWAIASGSTAAWVWTGMGAPEPWCVLRPEHPARSPLERTHWRAKLLSPRHHTTQKVAGLVILTPMSTAQALLLSPHPVDATAAQLWALEPHCALPFTEMVTNRRASRKTRATAHATLAHLAQLKMVYPDITRYTS